jgi:uncharacterized membrane protein
MRKLQNILTPHWLFLILAGISGICFIFVTPPALAPDEQDHFKKAWHISDGHFFPEKKDQRLGGKIPIEFLEFFIPYNYAISHHKYSLQGHKRKPAFSAKVENSTSDFTDFPNTSYYSPVSYFPQALAILILKNTGCSVSFLFYAGRIFAFLFWLVCMFFFLKNLKAFQWLFCALLLLAMQVFISASWSADTVTNVLSFILLGMIINFSQPGISMNRKRMVLLTFVILLLALAKMVYIGLAFCIFIIPATHYKSRKEYLTFSSLLVLMAFVTACLWSNAVFKDYISYSEYNPLYRDFATITKEANYHAQKDYIVHHPFYFVKVIFSSLAYHPEKYLTSYIGNLCYLNTPLPAFFIILFFALLLYTSITGNSSMKLSLKQKLILLGGSAASFSLLLLSQHLTWDKPGQGLVDVLQGRYLIPLFPAVFLLFNGIKPLAKNIFPLVCLIIFSGSVYGLSLIDKKYYHDEAVSEIKFSCGAEEVYDSHLKTTDPSILPEGVTGRSTAEARTGKYSLLLYPDSPYGYTYRVNLQQGDIIEVIAWQKGEGAEFIVSAQPRGCESIFTSYYQLMYMEKSGWRKMHYVITFNPNCNMKQAEAPVTLFFWNPKKTDCYVDDVEISIKKFKENYLYADK